MKRKLGSDAIEAFQAFAGTKPAARTMRARAVKDLEPALAELSLSRIADMIVSPDELRREVRKLRPDLTTRRVAQMCNSWMGEGWMGKLPDGTGYTLTTSVSARTELQKDEAPAAHRAAGKLGGRSKKPGS
ncbi:MAG: hypothetical protein WDO56_03855 [Gammaproteobacteria bacterium]